MDDARFLSELRRYWDEIPRRGPATPDDLDPDVAAVIRALHALREVPEPDPIFAGRLRENLMNATTIPLPRTDPLTSPGNNRWPLPSASRVVVPPLPVAHGHWSPARLATAVLVLLVLAGSILVIGPGRLGRQDDLPLFLPAISGTPAAETVVTEELVSLVLLADQMPSGGPFALVLWNFSLPPGVHAPVHPDAQTCCTGPQLTHVVAGELVLTVEAPVRLYRGEESAAEDIPAGTETTLHAGDTAVYDYAQPTQFANPGSSAAQVVSGGYWLGTLARPPFAGVNMYGGQSATPEAAPNFIDYAEIYPARELPAGPVRTTLVYASLPPDGVSPAPAPGSAVIAVGAREGISVGENSDGSLRNIAPETTELYVLTLEPTTAGAVLPFS
jgi:hypothetical protein